MPASQDCFWRPIFFLPGSSVALRELFLIRVLCSLSRRLSNERSPLCLLYDVVLLLLLWYYYTVEERGRDPLE